MMGLYPESNMNQLNDWQQTNAVPPIAGADFSEWQKELGSNALPFGLNTFPINQYGQSADFVLAVSEKNCSQFGSAWKVQKAEVETRWLTEAMATGSADVKSILTNNTLDLTCEYLNWAWYSYVDLTSADAFEWLRVNICSNYYTDLNLAQKSIDEQNQNIVSAGFMTMLASTINTTYQTPDYSTLVYKTMQVIDGYHFFTIASAMANSSIPSKNV